jgi:hypothetical protein
LWILEKNFPNGKLYRDSDNPKKKRLELHLDPTFQVSASTDDCDITYETESINLTGTGIRNGYNSSLDENYQLGLRFTGVHIPRGAKINSAYLTLVAHTSRTGTCDATIKGEASDNPSTFSTYSDFINRPRTTAYTTWSMPNTTAGTAYNSPDISNIIQEIVNRAGWQPGNALVIFISGGDNYRSWYSYDGSAANAAKLTVDFTVLVQDEGLGEDTAYVVTATVLVQDEGLGEDTAYVAAAATALDSGLGEDAASITFLIDVLDVGEGLDAAFTTASILAVDSGEGVDSASAGTYIEGSDSGLGEDVSEMFVMVTGEDFGLGEDSAEVRNLFMESLNKLFNFIVQILPLTIVTASISLITKVKKPRAKPPKEKPPPKKPPPAVKEEVIRKAIKTLEKRAERKK